MIKFEYQYDENHPKVTIELHADSTVGDLLEAFQGFLIASGYVLEGDIQIVEDEKETENV